MSVEILITVKIIVSVGVILLLSYIAEGAGSRWAGIISGLPTGSAIILYFYALENGGLFAETSALYNISGLAAMQSFIFGYYISDKFFNHPQILGSTFIGLLFYFLAAIVISYIHITLFSAFLIGSISLFVFIKLFKTTNVIKIENKKPTTFTLMLMRAIISGIIVLLITTIAYWVGPQWAGIFSAFPTTLYPLMIIMHRNYGKEFVDSIVKHVPQGLGGLLIYSLIIHLYCKKIGYNLSLLIGFAGVAVYLLVFIFLREAFRTKK